METLYANSLQGNFFWANKGAPMSYDTCYDIIGRFTQHIIRQPYNQHPFAATFYRDGTQKFGLRVNQQRQSVAVIKQGTAKSTVTFYTDRQLSSNDVRATMIKAIKAFTDQGAKAVPESLYAKFALGGTVVCVQYNHIPANHEYQFDTLASLMNSLFEYQRSNNYWCAANVAVRDQYNERPVNIFIFEKGPTTPGILRSNLTDTVESVQ